MATNQFLLELPLLYLSEQVRDGSTDVALRSTWRLSGRIWRRCSKISKAYLID